MSIGIGSFLWNRIEEKKIKKKELCKGILSQSELSKIFTQVRIPNYFIMERLLERLGMSTEKFDYILSQKDYELCQLRYEIGRELQKQNDGKIKELVEKYETIASENSIHKQYINYIYGIVAWKYGKQEEALQWLEKSIQCTMPDGFDSEVLIGAEEIKLLILFEKLNYEYGEQTKKKKKRYILFLQKIKKYVDEKIEDEEGKASIYPRITLDLVRFEIQRRQYHNAKRLCEESIELLTNHFMLQGLLEHIKLLIEIYQYIEVESEEKYKMNQIYKALLKFYEKEHIKETNFLLWESRGTQISLDWEIVKKIRSAYQISQEKLADDLYTQESISRIETKKRKVNCKKLEELKKKFDVHSDMYDSVLKTVDFHVLELEKKMTLYIQRREWERAEALLKRIRSCPLKNEVKNEQFFQYHRALLQYYKKEIKGEELEQRLWKALFLTKKEEVPIFETYLTEQEFYIINCLALVISKMGRKQEAITIWEHLLEYYDKSEVDSIFYYQNITLILLNLMIDTEENGQVERAEQLCQRGIQLSKDVMRADRLGQFIFTIGWFYDRYKKQVEKACCYYEQAFWILVLFKERKDSNIAREQYKKLTGIDLF